MKDKKPKLLILICLLCLGLLFGGMVLIPPYSNSQEAEIERFGNFGRLIITIVESELSDDSKIPLLLEAQQSLEDKQITVVELESLQKAYEVESSKTKD